MDEHGRLDGRARIGALILFLVFLLFCTTVYEPVLNWALRNDDYFHVYRGKTVLDNGFISAFRYVYSDFQREHYGWDEGGSQSNYFRPGVDYSFALDYWLYGMWAPGYRITNFILYFLSGAFVYGIAYLLFESSLAASLAGILFIFRSGNGNAIVGQVAGRTDALGGLAVLAAVFLFLHYRRKGGWLPLFLSVAVSLAGFYTKENTLGIPAILVLYDLLYLRPFALSRLYPHLLFFTAFAVYTAHRWLLFSGLGSPPLTFDFGIRKFANYLLAFLESLFPYRLGLDQSWFPYVLPVLLVALAVFTFICWKDDLTRRAVIFVFPAFFLAAGAIMLISIPVGRSAYAGSGLAAAWLGGAVVRSFTNLSSKGVARVLRWAPAALVPCLLFLNGVSFKAQIRAGTRANAIAEAVERDLSGELQRATPGSVIFMLSSPAACFGNKWYQDKQGIFYNGLQEWGYLTMRGTVRLQSLTQFVMPCFFPFSLHVTQLEPETFRIAIDGSRPTGWMILSQLDFSKFVSASKAENDIVSITMERSGVFTYPGRLGKVYQSNFPMEVRVRLKQRAAILLYHDGHTLWRLRGSDWETAGGQESRIAGTPVD